MTSKSLSSLGFVTWHPLTLANEKALLSSLPPSAGVYAIRCCNSQRAGEHSDLVYFGKATNGQGLKTRIRQYFHPGHGNLTSLRIKAECVGCTDFELSWVTRPIDQAKVLEALLINYFIEAHGALPPWNKRRA